METDYKKKLSDLFAAKTVLTFRDVSKKIKCSRITFDRFIREKGYYSSCNKNGAYYILANKCEFNESDLFMSGEIMFSRHRTLKKSVLNAIEKSEKGVFTEDVIDLLGPSSKILLSGLHTGKEITRGMFDGRFVYFSADPEISLIQRQNRKTYLDARRQSDAELLEEELPSTQIIIAVLTVLAMKTGMSAKQVRKKLKKQGVNISNDEIKKVMSFYNIPEKKT